MTCFYTACFQHQLAEQSVTSVTYGEEWGRGAAALGGGGEEGCGSAEWGRGAVALGGGGGRGAVALSGGGVCGTSSRAKN